MTAKRFLKLSVMLISGIVIGTVVHSQLSQFIDNSGHLSADIYDLQDKLVSIGEVATPAVVGIATTTIVKQRGMIDPYQQDLFYFFFGMPEQEFKQSGIGSGFIVNPNGYILTNEHVVSNAQDITVFLQNGQRYKAHLTGYDVRSDLAVIKIDATDLPYLDLGNSDNVKPGQWAIALGNPFTIFESNPTASMTLGIVSAIHRQLPSSDMQARYYGDLIQTDASINPGNSGGPLLNIDGKVIGLNVAIISRTGESAGIGFALPINRAKRILANLIEGKQIEYGWLGVAIQPLSQSLRENFALGENGGVLVAEVLEGAPAYEAGIQRRDIITKYDGKDITTVDSLISHVAETNVGQTVDIEIIRNGQTMTLPVTIEVRHSEKTAQILPIEKSTWRGITVQEPTEQMKRHYSAEEVQGVVVVSVVPSSAAATAGVQTGDLIDEINRQPVRTLNEFDTVTKELSGDILIHTYNDGYVIISE